MLEHYFLFFSCFLDMNDITEIQEPKEMNANIEKGEIVPQSMCIEQQGIHEYTFYEHQ